MGSIRGYARKEVAYLPGLMSMGPLLGTEVKRPGIFLSIGPYQ